MIVDRYVLAQYETEKKKKKKAEKTIRLMLGLPTTKRKEKMDQMDRQDEHPPLQNMLFQQTVETIIQVETLET
jgi:hypothetical protein